MLSEFSVAGMVCPNNVFLAPMAGYTNYPFRTMCEGLGAGLAFTEMVSAKGLHYGNEETRLLLYHGPQTAAPAAEKPHRPIAAQIFGSDPDIMREACESEELGDFDLIDINMGCPMPKVTRNGEGSALMDNMPLAEKIVAACAKSGKRISVKFRTGVVPARKVTREFAKMCEGAGASMITVHGRTADKIYAGPCDFEEIAAAKEAVSIPVVANGGVWNRKDADKILKMTGADAVMVARAALYDPRVFAELCGGERPPLLPIFLRQLHETEELYGPRFALVFMRKMAAFYIKGTHGAAAYKRRLFEAQTTAEVEALAREIWQ